MSKSLVNLGRTPIMRRIIAAALLLGTAIASSFLRSEGTPHWSDLTTNIAVALIALAFLHFRWRSREKKALSPQKARDIFS